MQTLLTISLRYYVIYLAGSVLVFALGVLLPVAFTVIHASLRLRNLSNKGGTRRTFVRALINQLLQSKTITWTKVTSLQNSLNEKGNRVQILEAK